MPDIDPRIRRRAQELLEVINTDYGLTSSEAIALNTPGLDFKTEPRFMASAGALAQRRLDAAELALELVEEMEQTEKENDVPKRNQSDLAKGWPKAKAAEPVQKTASRQNMPKHAPKSNQPVSTKDFQDVAASYDHRTGPASIRKQFRELRDRAQEQANRYLQGGGKPVSGVK